MPRDYPGVNPYIEAQGYRPDFHQTFLNYLREAIADGLPEDYEARIDERVCLSDLETDRVRLIKPDIAVIRGPRPSRADAGGTLLLEPVTIPTLILDDETETFLKVLHRPTRKVVTIIELLSPANKSGESRREYVQRRNAILRSDSHLVELDFLVSGLRVPMDRCLPPGDYYAVVSRRERRPDCEVYTWTVAMPLPALPIPLRAPDPDVVIDLAAVYRTAYDRGRYARSIDFDAEPDLPFAEEA